MNSKKMKKNIILLILGSISLIAVYSNGQADLLPGQQDPAINEALKSKNKFSTLPDSREEQIVPLSPEIYNEYKNAISKTAEMVFDEKTRSIAAEYDLDIVNVTWEDTGRYYGSSVGPNISDMTIQVGLQDLEDPDFFEVTCMPVIRYPNFEDISTDLNPRDFTLLVGNQNGEELKRISLFQFLDSPLDYLTDRTSWKGFNHKLLTKRDSEVLVSAQACFLPIPEGGKAVFNPVLFNYQSYSENPAVLTVLATREGTSVTIIDNTRDSFSSGSVWGQRLFFNRNGERASLTGQRESDYSRDNYLDTGDSENETPAVREESGLNMVLLIQIPLKQKERPYRYSYMLDEGIMYSEQKSISAEPESNLENAVIGSGPVEGPFTEIDGLKIQRDPDFPVRVTVQFYKATSNGIVSEEDINQIAAQIQRVYNQGDYVSSLVTGGGTGRITEYEGTKVEPQNWWNDFWRRHEENSGDNREEAIEKLEVLLGYDFMKHEVSELYLRDLLR